MFGGAFVLCAVNAGGENRQWVVATDSGGWWYNVHVFSNMSLMLSANSLSLASSAAEMRARYVASLPLSSFHTSRHSLFCFP